MFLRYKDFIWKFCIHHLKLYCTPVRQTLEQKVLEFPLSCIEPLPFPHSICLHNNSIYFSRFSLLLFSILLTAHVFFFLFLSSTFFSLVFFAHNFIDFVDGLLTLWNTTSKSSSFPCKSPQMVTCLLIAVEAWFRFGRRFSRIVASFKMPATYFACRRLYCMTMRGRRRRRI